MTKHKHFSVLLFLVFAISTASIAQNNTDNLNHNPFESPPDTIPKIFGKGIITIEDRAEFGLAISPSYDESYILFNSRRPDSFGEHDIYIVFKTNKGSWTAPINLGGQINTDVSETCPSISPDGKFIFFSRYNDLNGKPDIYWVSSSVIGKLRNQLLITTVKN